MSKPSNAKTIAKVLYNGGLAVANELPGKGTWTVDVWDLDQELEYQRTGIVPEPAYHAYYACREDALEDLACWAEWPDTAK